MGNKLEPEHVKTLLDFVLSVTDSDMRHEHQLNGALDSLKLYYTKPVTSYLIEVWVSGGVTGSRSSFLKENGEYRVFDSQRSAELVASELRKRKMNCNHGATVIPTGPIKKGIEKWKS